MKQVSVVVATYRRDLPLKNALDSLAAQTYGDVQIVLVNDNADDQWNDRVAVIVEDFKRENPTAHI